MSDDFQITLKTTRALIRRLEDTVSVLMYKIVGTILQKVETLMCEESGFFHSMPTEDEAQFNAITEELILLTKYFKNNSAVFETGKIKAKFRNIQDKYLVLYDSLKSENTLEPLLYDAISKPADHAVDMNPAATTASPDPTPPTLNPPQHRGIDALPVLNPLAASQANMTTTASRLKLWLTDTAFPESTNAAKRFGDIHHADNPLWKKVFQSLHNVYAFIVSIAEDLVRGAVKLGFFVLEKTCSLIDKLIGLLKGDVNSFKVLQKTVNAVGRGVDDALRQNFELAKNPLGMFTRLAGMLNLILGYIVKIKETTEKSGAKSAINMILEDGRAKLAEATAYAKEHPYEAIRHLACIATHITTMALLIKYVPAGKTPVVNNTPKPMAMRVPQIAPAPPPAMLAQTAAAGNTTAQIATTALAPAPISGLLPRSTETQADNLLALIKILDILDPDDDDLYQHCANALITLKHPPFKRHVTHKITELKGIVDILDPTNPDDKEAYQHTNSSLLAYQRLLAKIQPSSVSRNPSALYGARQADQLPATGGNSKSELSFSY